MRRQLRKEIVQQVCDALKIPRDRPFRKLTEKQREKLLHGVPGKKIALDLSYEGKRLRYRSKEERVWITRRGRELARISRRDGTLLTRSTRKGRHYRLGPGRSHGRHLLGPRRITAPHV